MQGSSLVIREDVRMYSVDFSDERIRELITWYVKSLQRAIDEIWENMEWKYDFKRRYAKVRIPVIPRNKEFKKYLRDKLMKDNPYTKHWVDAVIRTAYSIMENWRKRYVKGMARKKKPTVKRRFARCKITLMKVDYSRKTIRITLKPYEYIEVSYANQWFSKRIDEWKVGGVVLKDDRVLIPFKKENTYRVNREIAWDCNEKTIDGFSPQMGFVQVDLRKLITARIRYQEKRSRIQSLMKRKPKSARKLWEKYSRRERNVCRDIERKIAIEIVNAFPNTLHIFEKLNKQKMISKRKNKNKNLRKRVARISWINIIREVEMRAPVKKVDPYFTSKTCPLCGYVNKDLRGQVFECPRCGWRIDRQKNASINIYLKMKGFPPSPNTFYRVVTKRMIHSGKVWMRRGSGVTQIGGETNEMLPNERGDEAGVPQSLHRQIKAYVG
ncbi:zinc ribbon domain-containing protein [Staphylothermus hellenicus]|uniref:Transposase, IS605 OrfB family n=1 Tax=Staphylothermus hellenicus (strain DSM 12710 / JCM 10830 / BK20S6-10-b1 / P8) TaxID=591019 RepID=D7DB18_STAHD|nr:zinc ribbon domain-containing protein [Staphylothermus hellenicus]ADI31365.1 transposase, IS605 OrfB family [Staphylothermus hellenicus DSM 12710]